MKKRIISYIKGGQITANEWLNKAEEGSTDEAYSRGVLDALNTVLEYINSTF